MATIPMQVDHSVTFKSGEASDDIGQYCCAVLDSTAGQCVLPSGNNSVEVCVGVATAIVAAGTAGEFVQDGIMWVKTTAETIAIGDTLVIGDTSGRVSPKDAGATTQKLCIVGYALEAAAAVNTIIAVQLVLQNAYSS